MRKPYAAALVALCACGSSDAGGPALVGTNWLSANGSVGVGMDLKSDGTYTLQKFSIGTSPLQDEVETGVYSLSGNSITFTAHEWTCAGPVAVFTMTYALNGSVLTLANAVGVTTFSPDTSPPWAGVATTLGCFTRSGFVASPLAPVTN
jgi:hypothetical protein